MKALLRSGPVVALIGGLIWLWMALIRRTVRWSVEGESDAKAAWTAAPGMIVAAWHSRILLLPSGWNMMIRHWPGRTAPSAMLISLSRDGEAVARAIKHLGLEPIRGSAGNKKKKTKDKGGARAIAEAVRRLKTGGAVCITPDGPRGPREVAGLGQVWLAQRAGVPILPCALPSAPAKRLATWDRFIIPFPFTRGAIVFGPVLQTSREDDPETLRAELQRRLAAATLRAEDIVGLAHLSEEIPAE